MSKLQRGLKQPSVNSDKIEHLMSCLRTVLKKIKVTGGPERKNVNTK